jgi:L-aspartate oxidase
MEHKTDFLVIGSGLAGLSFALKVADHGKVILLTKPVLEETNTRYAQGGIASVMYAPDNLEKHVRDTLTTGDRLCDEKTVRMVVSEGPKQIEELIRWGANFDRLTDGKFDLNREGGHSEHRILHHKDNTGAEIMRALSEKARLHPNIEILENHFAMDLITQHHQGTPIFRGNPEIECYGAYALNISKNQIDTILSKVTLLATGGSGFIYQVTTNPPIATGDGSPWHTGLSFCEHTEFVQFHPTSLYHPGETPILPDHRSLGGFGGILKTQDGVEFMQKYDPRGRWLRGISSPALSTASSRTVGGLCALGLHHTEPEGLKSQLPNIYQKCLSIGIDMTNEPIPWCPQLTISVAESVLMRMGSQRSSTSMPPERWPALDYMELTDWHLTITGSCYVRPPGSHGRHHEDFKHPPSGRDTSVE